MIVVCRESTTSMTSVPNPLKFMLPHLAKLKTLCDEMKDASDQVCARAICIN